MEFSISTEVKSTGAGEVGLLYIKGALDQKSLEVFEEKVQELYQKDVYRLILDLSGATAINSTGLGLIINMVHQAETASGGIRLMKVADKFKALFGMLGLDSRLPILDTEEEAIASF